MALLKFLTAIVLLLGLGAVSVWFYRHHPPPAAHSARPTPPDAATLQLHTVTVDQKGDRGRNHAGDDIHVRWAYTVTGVPAMDSQITGWLSSRCPEGDTVCSAPL